MINIAFIDQLCFVDQLYFIYIGYRNTIGFNLIKYAKHSAAFFLFIFTAYLIAGNVVKGLSYPSVDDDSEQLSWASNCLNLTELTHLKQVQDYFKSGEEVPAETHSSPAYLNCHISMNLLPAAEPLLLVPGPDKYSIRLSISYLVSQSYIYQEPDPPQYA